MNSESLVSNSELSEGISRLKKSGQIRIKNENGTVRYEQIGQSGEIEEYSPVAIENFYDGAIYYQLNHVNQSETWDCGLTCISMIFSYVF